MNRHRNFSERIIKKYSFFRKSGRLPALVFLRLSGLRDTGRKNSVEKNTRPEWRINNYFEFHYYTGVIRKSIKAPENQPQKQYNIVSFYRNILQTGMIRCRVDRQSLESQKFFRVFGGSALSYPSVKYPSVKKDNLLPAFYTITESDKQTVKPTVILTVLPARHITGSYLQKIFNIVNTGSGSPATASKELLMNKSKNAEETDIPSLQQGVRNHHGNIPGKYEKDEKNVSFPVLIPITSPAKTVLDSMHLASNGHSQKTGAKDEGLKYNKTTPPSGIRSSNKESRFLDLIPTKIKIPTYKHMLSERADTELKRITRMDQSIKTVLNRNIFTGLILNVQKMNEQSSSRKQDMIPGNVARAAKPDLHFAGNSGRTEKPMRIEDTIDTIVRKHTDLVLRKTSAEKITNNVNKPDIVKTAKEEIREGDINKNISRERKQGEINTIADTVYKLIERRLLIEKEKRGLV